ncbi:MAG: ABC transporter permease, partial [Acidobacteria bacterium]|nr:ABC transporter permease [Acidobacteriota bacterium]
MLDDLRFRLRALFRRDDVEDDLDDELRFHLERAAEQQIARGLSPREAYRQAQLAFGPIDFVKEDCRRSWGIRQLDALRQDGTFALRLIRKHPALSAISAISLAIGIGFNTTLFALLDATLLRRLPLDRPEQLVDVYTSEVDGFAWYGSSYPDYLDLRRGVRALSGLVGYVPAMGAVRTGDRSRAMPVEAVTGNYFQALGVPAAHGRVLLPEDDRPGAPPVVVVSSAFWSAAFDRGPGAIGRSLRIGGRRYTIVGVAPEGFAGMTAPIL